MIEVQSLTRRYGAQLAVDDVSFSIGDREIVGLLGHNGAGKTTIMKMLSGYLEPSAGSIRVDGQLLADGAREVQRQLGYLPESLPLYPEMMVADYLDYVATTRGIPRAQRMQSVREAVAATDLGERALDPIHTLSRGLRQRVGVAQAILGKPRLLILDEPANGLDLRHTDHMRRLVRRLAQRATVILSTHIMEEVEAVCDRVMVLRSGRLQMDQPLAALRDSHSLYLKTCGTAPGLAELLARLPQVAGVREEPGGSEFALALHTGADSDTAASNVARCVMEAGARLYCLNPVTRNLGAILREASGEDEWEEPPETDGQPAAQGDAEPGGHDGH